MQRSATGRSTNPVVPLQASDHRHPSGRSTARFAATAARERPIGGRSARSLGDGFTLIEMLAVIAIMAIIAGLLMLSTGDGGREREIRHHAERIAALMTLAREEVLLGAGVVGVAFTQDRYHFQRQQRTGDDRLEWLDLPATGPLRPRSVGDAEIEFALRVEGRRVTLERDPEYPAPNLFLEATGEITPFTLVLFDRNERQRAVRLSGQIDGSLAVEHVDGRRPWE